MVLVRINFMFHLLSYRDSYYYLFIRTPNIFIITDINKAKIMTSYKTKLYCDLIITDNIKINYVSFIRYIYVYCMVLLCISLSFFYITTLIFLSYFLNLKGSFFTLQIFNFHTIVSSFSYLF